MRETRGGTAAANSTGADATPLRQACIDQALLIIEQEGLEQLSLREVARRLNVSHQAPYKHFENRDHIVAEAVAKAFAGFAAHLRARPHSDDPGADLAALGAAYVAYAVRHPAQYRLMFGAPPPDAERYPHVARLAAAPFEILRAAVERLPGRGGAAEMERDALFAWTAVHGLASFLNTPMATRPGGTADDLGEIVGHQLRRIGAGLSLRR